MSQRLISVLAELYPNTSDARRIADEARLTLSRIDFNGSAITFWTNVFNEAVANNMVGVLMLTPLREYPGNIELHDAWREFNFQRRTHAISESNVNHPIFAELVADFLQETREDVRIIKEQLHTKFLTRQEAVYMAFLLLAVMIIFNLLSDRGPVTTLLTVLK